MKYAKSSITSTADKLILEIIKRENTATETFYELDSDDNVSRQIEIRDYNKTVTLLKVNKYFKVTGYSTFDSLTFEAIWSGGAQRFKSYKIIRLWEKERTAISKPLRYAKLVREFEDDFKLYDIPDIIYYEVGHNQNVYRRISVHTRERTLSLNQLDRNPILGLPCDNSLQEGPFPHIAEYTKTLQAIEHIAFESIWAGKSEEYQSYSILKVWEGLQS